MDNAAIKRSHFWHAIGSSAAWGKYNAAWSYLQALKVTQ